MEQIMKLIGIPIAILLLIPPLLLIAWYLRCLVIICNRVQ
jgi:hypothetical protein